jgi:hypothetical protein
MEYITRIASYERPVYGANRHYEGGFLSRALFSIVRGVRAWRVLGLEARSALRRPRGPSATAGRRRRDGLKDRPTLAKTARMGHPEKRKADPSSRTPRDDNVKLRTRSRASECLAATERSLGYARDDPPSPGAFGGYGAAGGQHTDTKSRSLPPRRPGTNVRQTPATGFGMTATAPERSLHYGRDDNVRAVAPARTVGDSI